MKSGRSIFISGATGLLGSELLRRLLAWEPASNAYVLVRGVDDEVVKSRGESLIKDLFPGEVARADARGRVKFVRGDICRPRMGIEAPLFAEIASQVTDVVHCAAEVRFDLSLDEARAINVEGTRNAFALAQQAHKANARFNAFHHVSTYGVSRPLPGSDIVLEEPPRPDAEYHNTYERTKAEAEQFLFDHAGSVPFSVYRPSIIMGESSTGWTRDFKVIYIVLRIYERGLLPAGVPFLVQRGGRADSVHLDYVADSLYALTRNPTRKNGKIYHIVSNDPSTSGEAFAYITELMRKMVAERQGRNLAPVEIREVDSLLEEAFSSGNADGEVIAVLKDFLPYFSKSWTFDDRNTREGLAESSVRHHIGPESWPRLLDFCLRSEWGRRPQPRPPLSDCVLK